MGVQHSQFLIAEDVEQLLHQSIAGQGLVTDDAGEVTFSLQHFPPWSVQQRITQAVDSCRGSFEGHRHTLLSSAGDPVAGN